MIIINIIILNIKLFIRDYFIIKNSLKSLKVLKESINYTIRIRNQRL